MAGTRQASGRPGQGLPARYDFLSDNSAGACPEAMDSLVAGNAGFAPGYGADETTRRAREAIQQLFDADADVRFVATGTAANAIACAALCGPFEAMLAHEHAHIRTHEAGAPAFFGQGLRIRGVSGRNGKIDPDALVAAIAEPETASRQSAAAISITNVTEYGTLYGDAEITRLCGLARANGLGIHIDGSRLANAAAAGFAPSLLAKAGADIAIVGGSKAGMPFGEAIVLFDRDAAHRFDARLKQAGQLVSKSRFLAAPWLALMAGSNGDPAWIVHARHANAMARRLAEAMPFSAVYPVEANCVFVKLSDAQHERLAGKGWRVGRYWGCTRFVCSWATNAEAVDALAYDLNDIS